MPTSDWKACVWITALFCVAEAPISASAAPCLSYLRAERSYQEKVGKPPDHRAIGAALSRLTLSQKPQGDPWQKYIDAQAKKDWATDYQDRLYKEDAKEQLFGRSLPDIRTKMKTAHDRIMEALTESDRAGKSLLEWLQKNGISEHAGRLLQWFVDSYRKTNKLYGSEPPDLVFRVAVHERQTMCPP